LYQNRIHFKKKILRLTEFSINRASSVFPVDTYRQKLHDLGEEEEVSSSSSLTLQWSYITQRPYPKKSPERGERWKLRHGTSCCLSSGDLLLAAAETEGEEWIHKKRMSSLYICTFVVWIFMNKFIFSLTKVWIFYKQHLYYF